jgi:DNA-directed RNA polymerase subunit M/transcription elongation factor TFIIS
MAPHTLFPAKSDESCPDTSSKTVVTHSKPTAFPSALRAKRSEVQTINDDDVQTSVVIQHPCEKCGREEVRYYTQQLRSADEGTTVFYECECGHKCVALPPSCVQHLLTRSCRWNTNN